MRTPLCPRGRILCRKNESMNKHDPAGWNAAIPPYDTEAAEQCRQRWNAIAKPLGCLGLLEQAVESIAGVTGNHRHHIDKRAVVVFCADNGVVGQGVTQTGSEVTAILARNLTTGAVSICKMAEVARVDVVPVDMGILPDLRLPGLLDRRIAAGTRDIAIGPAMTKDQALQAINAGIDLAVDLCGKGYTLLLAGEVGIGNTTTASAMASVLLGKAPAEVTGRGAGLSSEGIRRKIQIIETAIQINQPDPADPLDILAKLGGFDIAGMVGLHIGAARMRIPVVIDGLIGSVAALAAKRLCPACASAMLASHVSAEPAATMLLDALGLRPLIHAGLCLGEGSGAVAAVPLLDMAYAVYDNMVTFEQTAIEAYQPL